MCRIGYFPKGMTEVFNRPDIVQILLALEKSKGGHGNGFYYFGGDHIYKSAKMPINKMIKKGAWKQGFLFHTRLATHGNHTRRNTHPFRLDGGEVVIHNGIWSDYKYALPFCNPKSETDSEVLGYWIRQNEYKRMIPDYGSNAILMRIVVNGETKVVVGKQSSGSLKVIKKDNYCWIQSENPKGTYYDNSYEIKEGLYVIDPTIEGVLTLPEHKYKTTYNYHNSYNYKYNRNKQTSIVEVVKKQDDGYWWAWGGVI